MYGNEFVNNNNNNFVNGNVTPWGYNQGRPQNFQGGFQNFNLGGSSPFANNVNNGYWDNGGVYGSNVANGYDYYGNNNANFIPPGGTTTPGSGYNLQGFGAIASGISGVYGAYQAGREVDVYRQSIEDRSRQWQANFDLQKDTYNLNIQSKNKAAGYSKYGEI